MLREIDERTSDNLRVTLYWESNDGTLTVEVEDLSTGSGPVLTGVPPTDRKAAFLHPFTYARKAAA